VHPARGNPDAPLFCGVGNRNSDRAISLSTVLRGLVKAYYHNAGIAGRKKTTHSLRHTFVTQLINAGVEPIKVIAATRHRSLDTMLGYVNEMQREGDPAEAYIDF
jgi:site-specific recombinase XerD